MMGLEEHLLHMFKDDFEFHQEAAPSHLGSVMRGQAPLPTGRPIDSGEDADVAVAAAAPSDTAAAVSTDAPPTGAPTWTADGEKELKKIPFFVRGKAKRNTERFAVDQGIALITVETLYDAKAHFSR
jgi:light-independent protochlorophyllide reductase subunit B